MARERQSWGTVLGIRRGQDSFRSPPGRPRKRKAQNDDDAPGKRRELRSTKPRCGTRDAGRLRQVETHTATVLLTDEHLHKMIENHLLQENELNDQSKVARVVQQLVEHQLRICG